MIGVWVYSIDLLHVSTESQIIVNFFLNIQFVTIMYLRFSCHLISQFKLNYQGFSTFSFFYVLYLYIKTPKIKIKRIKWKCLLVEKRFFFIYWRENTFHFYYFGLDVNDCENCFAVNSLLLFYIFGHSNPFDVLYVFMLFHNLLLLLFILLVFSSFFFLTSDQSKDKLYIC